MYISAGLYCNILLLGLFLLECCDMIKLWLGYVGTQKLLGQYRKTSCCGLKSRCSPTWWIYHTLKKKKSIHTTQILKWKMGICKSVWGDAFNTWWAQTIFTLGHHMHHCHHLSCNLVPCVITDQKHNRPSGFCVRLSKPFLWSLFLTRKDTQRSTSVQLSWK